MDPDLQFLIKILTKIFSIFVTNQRTGFAVTQKPKSVFSDVCSKTELVSSVLKIVQQ
jgi:hypothetical protein